MDEINKITIRKSKGYAMGNWWAWQMTGQDKPLELVKKDIPEPGPGEVLVEVAGCGVCHTDLSF